MQRWLFKTEPTDYSLADLAREKQTVWSGVSNAMARIHLRKVVRGDPILIYHTGKEKSIVGVMKALADSIENGADVTVEVVFVKEFASPVSLALIRSRKEFAEWDLVRNSRLSVMPVTSENWKLIEQLAGE